jgi:DNA-binding transcriptional regulator PaaX
MPKPLSPLSLDILKYLDSRFGATLHEIYNAHEQAKSNKIVYDTLYRLLNQSLITLTKNGYQITPEGVKVIHTYFPKKDGVWKLIIFDIPESKRAVRNFLRQKLQLLHFKKWQNSIWVSPYALEEDLEKELLQLAQKFFVRLIKTTDINYDKDLKKLFPD